MIEIKFPKIEDIDLRANYIENGFIYYDDYNSIYSFEAQFDNESFNGKIYYWDGETEDGHIKEAKELDFESKLYKHIRKKAIVDYIMSQF